MGGFIKVTLRDKSEITSNVLHTSSLDDFLADYQNIFENDISELITKNAINKDVELVSKYHDQVNTLTPFSYGYVFIDRVAKKVFFINDYNGVSIFSSFNFKKETFDKLVNQKYIVKMQKGYNSETKSFAVVEEYDIRKSYLMSELTCYRKLWSALPYIEEISSIDKKIEDISSIESILNELHLLRESRKSSDESEFDFINDLIIDKFKNWEFIEDNKTKESYEDLYNHLMEENLLSLDEIKIWTKEIEAVDY